MVAMMREVSVAMMAVMMVEVMVAVMVVVELLKMIRMWTPCG